MKREGEVEGDARVDEVDCSGDDGTVEPLL
jgi:hypothetical protein